MNIPNKISMRSKNRSYSRGTAGFTIVELLIVIIVIGILATISIVAYSGVQNRAKDSKAAINANTTQKAAEAYFADNGAYPTTTAMFSASIITLPSSITLLKAATASTIPSPNVSAANGENSILYRYILTSGVATGACIFFWDFVPAGGGSAAISSGIYLGNATSSNCSATVPANGNTLTS